MDKTGIKLEINEKDLTLVCLSIENEELKRKLKYDNIIFNRLKNKNMLLSVVAVVSLSIAYKTYKKLEEIREVKQKETVNEEEHI